jgi:hypothetical protein
MGLAFTSFFAGFVLSLAGFLSALRVGAFHAKSMAGFAGILAVRLRLLGLGGWKGE